MLCMKIMSYAASTLRRTQQHDFVSAAAQACAGSPAALARHN
jgi:hypothetical protein